MSRGFVIKIPINYDIVIVCDFKIVYRAGGTFIKITLLTTFKLRSPLTANGVLLLPIAG